MTCPPCGHEERGERRDRKVVPTAAPLLIFTAKVSAAAPGTSMRARAGHRAGGV